MVPENPQITTINLNFSSISGLLLRFATHLQHKCSQYNLTATTLPILTTFFTKTSKTLLHLFNQLPSLSHIQHKLTQIDSHYNLTTSLADVISRFITPIITTLFPQSAHFFNDVLTAEMIARGLILFVCLRLLIRLCGFVGTVVISGVVGFSFRFVFKVVLFPVSFVLSCLGFGGKKKKKGGRTMKAPGRRPVRRISRPFFEDNPKKYFSDLRGEH